MIVLLLFTHIHGNADTILVDTTKLPAEYRHPIEGAVRDPGSYDPVRYAELFEPQLVCHLISRARVDFPALVKGIVCFDSWILGLNARQRGVA